MYNGLIDENSRAKLLNINAKESSDSGFTSKHLLVELEFEYPEIETFVKYQIRAYEKAEGIYTRVGFKGNMGKYIKTKTQTKGIKISLKEGKDTYDYEINGVAPNYIADYART